MVSVRQVVAACAAPASRLHLPWMYFDGCAVAVSNAELATGALDVQPIEPPNEAASPPGRPMKGHRWQYSDHNG